MKKLGEEIDSVKEKFRRETGPEVAEIAEAHVAETHERMFTITRDRQVALSLL